MSALPVAPKGPKLPPKARPLRRILIGSCNNEESPSKTLATIAREEADLFLMIGDNVYGDKDKGRKINGDKDPELKELQESFAELSQRAEFKALRKKHPVMAVWDDHDYAKNDGGREFINRKKAEQIHEHFWGLNKTEVGRRPGVYYARTFGPKGQRTQIILLDTRFFRSPLTKTDRRAPGKERYIPSTQPADKQDMLGSKQWKWLERMLKKPADLRIIASSIQVIPDVHGWESWHKLPAERQRLFETLKRTKAKGVIFISGDRHTAFIYEKKGVLPYPLRELTSSSLNRPEHRGADEKDAYQIGRAYTNSNFGAIAINWEKNRVDLTIHGTNGNAVRKKSFQFR